MAQKELKTEVNGL